MIIKLTNATAAHKGKVIGLNADAIVSVHTETTPRTSEDGSITTLEEVTYVFCPPHGTWEVSESIDEISEKINGKRSWL
jgi:hypothetical protein